MTIENATPSTRLDQADMLSIIGGLYDKLVNDVADRVQAALADNITAQIEHAMDTWASNAVIIDDRITDYVSHTLNLDSKLDEWAMTSGTLEDKITEGVQSFVDNQLDVDDVVRGALDNLDLDDMVTTSVGDFIRNNVTVSIDTI
jgi:hypothetical protein